MGCSEPRGAARARGLRQGLHAGNQGPAAVARRTPQRGDAREAQQGGEREERPRSAGATASG